MNDNRIVWQEIKSNVSIPNIKYKNNLEQTHSHTRTSRVLPLWEPSENKTVMSLESGDALAKTLGSKDHSTSMTLRCCLLVNDLVP